MGNTVGVQPRLAPVCLPAKPALRSLARAHAQIMLNHAVAKSVVCWLIRLVCEHVGSSNSFSSAEADAAAAGGQPLSANLVFSSLATPLTCSIMF